MRFMPLGEHLIGVPAGSGHDATHFSDILSGNVFVKEIAHRVHEIRRGDRHWSGWESFPEPIADRIPAQTDARHTPKPFREVSA